MAYPSTFLTLQNAVLAKGRLEPVDDRDKVKDWLNQAQAQSCLESEALQTLAEMSTTAGVVSYTISPTAVRIKGMYTTFGGVQYKPLEPISLQRMLELRVGSGVDNTTGSLRYYTLIGLSEFELYPTPTGDETIAIYYVRQPSTMTNDLDTPELPEPFASKLLEFGALCDAADFKRDDQLQMYQQKYEIWMQRLRAHLNRKRGGVPEQMLVYGSPSYSPHDRSMDIGY